MILAWWPCWLAELLPALLPDSVEVLVIRLSELSEPCRYGNVIMRDEAHGTAPITKCYILYPIALSLIGKRAYTWLIGWFDSDTLYSSAWVARVFYGTAAAQR